MTARVGVLGLHGDFSEHLTTLRGIGADGIDVRRPEQLDDIDALIIPGGESTTIGKLAEHYGITPKFFFSGRRRHTRWNCGWSSDVCSSDLMAVTAGDLRPASG